MLAELIRAFCNEPENDYKVYENYTKTRTTMFGEMTTTTIGIVVKPDCNLFDVLTQLTSYLEAKGFDDLLELEGADIDYPDPDSPDSDAIIYFPAIRGYHPLQQ